MSWAPLALNLMLFYMYRTADFWVCSSTSQGCGSFHFWPFILNVKNLNVVQFFVKYTMKSECFSDHHLQEKFFKGLVVQLDLW